MLKNIRGKRVAIMILAFGSAATLPATPSLASPTCEELAIMACNTYFPLGLFVGHYSTIEECYEGEIEFRCVYGKGAGSGDTLSFTKNDTEFYDPSSNPALAGTTYQSLT